MSNSCEMCIRSQEEVIIAGGLSENQVHGAAHIAATLQVAAIALEMNNFSNLSNQESAAGV